MEKEKNNQIDLTQKVDISYGENFETGYIYSDWDKCPDEDSLRNLKEYLDTNQEYMNVDSEEDDYNCEIVPDEDIKIDTKALERLCQEFRGVLFKVNETFDPIDKISILEVFIKKILESQDVKELLLGNPFGPDIDESTYETGDNWLGHTMEEAYVAFQDQDPSLQWWESPWIAYTYPWDTHNESGHTIYYQSWDPSKICVRLGIVDDTVKFTSQTLECVDKHGDKTNLLPETDWLKLGNIGDPDFIIQLVELILEVPKIWQYSAKYPGLHKMK